jgi:hypothetical protein
MADREACAEKLIAAMEGATPETRAALLEVVGGVGGQKALQALATAGKGTDPQLQDVATRLLGEWMTIDAGPVLLDLAANAPGDKYKTRALRGLIRIARQFSMPEKQRAELCRQALKTASRPAEQKLILDVLARYPSGPTLGVAVGAAATPALKDEATRTSATIAEKLGGKGIAPVELLALLQSPAKVEILKAEYGAGGQQKDVTETLRKQAQETALIKLASPSYNEAFGGDPAPWTPKQLRVKYRLDGAEGEASFAENAVIILRKPKP